MRARWLIVAAALGGCSLIVPGPDDYEFGGREDAGVVGDDAGEMDGGEVEADAGEPDADAGPDAGCASGEMLCGGACVDTQADPANCGGCGTVCDDGWICREGDCFDPPISIASGPAHVCALRGSGQVNCWGTNGLGELGDGSVIEPPGPVEVVGLTEVASVSAGGFTFSDAIGTTCASQRGGDLLCWGHSNGVFAASESSSPQRVADVPAAVMVDQSYLLGCAITSMARPYCWGRFNDMEPERAPREVVALGIAGPWVDRLSVGGGHVCAVSSDSRLFCVGSNAQGQLGVPSSTIALAEEFRPVAGFDDAVDVAASVSGTCVVKADHTVSCFGAEATLGIGSMTFDEHPSPEAVAGVTDVVRISASAAGAATCAIHGPGREVSCWGTDFLDITAPFGDRLGARPYAIPGATGAQDIAVGSNHFCVLIDSTVYCLGGNFYGQLGDRSLSGTGELVEVVLP